MPVSVNITGKKILIVGGGKIGFHKATVLREFTEHVTVVSQEFHEGFELLPFTLIKKDYEKTDLDGAFLVYICTGNATLNALIKRDAGEAGALACVCDRPELCDVISPAVYKDGHLTVAVSSNARNVRLSVAVRNRIRTLAQNGTLSLEQP